MPFHPVLLVQVDKHVAFISGLKLTKNNNDMHKVSQCTANLRGQATSSASAVRSDSGHKRRGDDAQGQGQHQPSRP
jgi:hypothetical protein